jgi:hypothetical protein
MMTKILAAVRGSQQPNYAEGTDEQPQLNNRGEQIVANGLPLLAQLVNSGNSYWAGTTTAAAPVVAIPTTAALIALWNGEPDNGKSYIIDSVWVVQVVVTAAIQAMGILANVSQAQIPTAITNTITPRPLRGNLPYRGAGRVAVGITLGAVDGIAANWMPIGTVAAPANTLQVGTITDVDLKGLIIIPPKGQLSLTALAGAATASSIQIGFRWHEALLPPVV